MGWKSHVETFNPSPHAQILTAMLCQTIQCEDGSETPDAQADTHQESQDPLLPSSTWYAFIIMERFG